MSTQRSPLELTTGLSYRAVSDRQDAEETALLLVHVVCVGLQGKRDDNLF